jgi:hypothetical protein
MMRLKPAHGLILLNLALAAGLAYMWLDEQGRPRDLSWTPPAPLVPDAQAHVMAHSVGAAPDMVAFAQVLERPLFSPTRRPPPPPKPPAPPPPPDPLANVHIYGIFVGEEEGTGGMLASIGGKVRRVTTADDVSGWKIKAFKEREVTLARGGETRVLRLVQARPTAAPQPGAAAPPRPAAGAAAAPSVPMSPANAERAERRRRLAESRAAAAAERGQ